MNSWLDPSEVCMQTSPWKNSDAYSHFAMKNFFATLQIFLKKKCRKYATKNFNVSSHKDGNKDKFLLLIFIQHCKGIPRNGINKHIYWSYTLWVLLKKIFFTCSVVMHSSSSPRLAQNLSLLAWHSESSDYCCGTAKKCHRFITEDKKKEGICNAQNQ